MSVVSKTGTETFPWCRSKLISVQPKIRLLRPRSTNLCATASQVARVFSVMTSRQSSSQMMRCVSARSALSATSGFNPWALSRSIKEPLFHRESGRHQAGRPLSFCSNGSSGHRRFAAWEWRCLRSPDRRPCVHGVCCRNEHIRAASLLALVLWRSIRARLGARLQRPAASQSLRNRRIG